MKSVCQSFAARFGDVECLECFSIWKTAFSSRYSYFRRCMRARSTEIIHNHAKLEDCCY